MHLISHHSKVLKSQSIKKMVKPLGMFLLMVIFHASASAQRTISLREYLRLSDIYNKAEEKDGLDDLDDVVYIKDVNELDKFVGRWTGSLDGKTYLLDVVKKINVNFYKTPPSKDFLMVWITIKSSDGSTLFTNTSKAESSNYFRGSFFQPNTNIYMLNFGGNCAKYIGQANFYFAADGRLTLTYGRINDIFAKGDCESVLPPKILLTKVLLEE